jgi:recombinational DNA repair protein (RecF pathway)
MEENILILTNDLDKKCAHCGRVLPILKFYRKREAKDTYQSWCIECQREYKAKRYVETKSKRIMAGSLMLSEIPGKMDTMSREELVITRNVLKKTLSLFNKKIKK